MSIVLPTTGQLNWDVPLNLALRNLASAGMHPNDHGWLVWTADPAACPASDAQVNGTVRMIKLPVMPQAYTITSVKYFIATAATTPTVGQNFAGIYDSAGTRLAVSADISADTSSLGLKTWAMTVPPVIAPGAAVWVGLVFNAATPPTGVAQSAVTGRETLFNADLSVAAARFTSGPTAQTSLPASITMASRTLIPRSPWVAVA